jgi:membrane protease YdiL (CAAX protease family)
MLVFLSMGATLGIGLGNLLGTATAVGSFSVWAQAILFVLLAMVGVGWVVRRGTGETFARLGIVAPTFMQVLIGLGLALVMVVFVTVASAAAAQFGFGFDADVEELTEQLLGGLTQSLFGILTLGAAAALGEETLMRGAAQPRLGLVYTALLFALLHSNYGVSFSTLIVFVLGLVLGWVRIRHNTTTAMILHAAYNGVLGLLAYFSIELMGQ